MPPHVLERQRIQQLIEAAGERLTGEWVLVGGALAALWLSPERVTEDVDLVSISDLPERRYQLMDFALDHGLPIEAVNSAADFFLRRIPGWTDDLELLHAGSRARILRPTPTLFLLLKCERLSEADLSDCLALLALAERGEIAIDATRVLARLDALGDPDSGPAALRRGRLRAALAAWFDVSRRSPP
jgi:hypothetical protein